ncbi:MAG: T9SS type A sorting domain-containing protein, partial [Bacteroidota bacterium]
QQQNQNIVSLSVNPISQKSSLKFFLEHEDKVMVELFNSKGHLVLRTNQLDANPGYNEIKPFTDVNSLASGIYFIRIGFSDRNELIKAIKL